MWLFLCKHKCLRHVREDSVITVDDDQVNGSIGGYAENIVSGMARAASAPCSRLLPLHAFWCGDTGDVLLQIRTSLDIQLSWVKYTLSATTSGSLQDQNDRAQMTRMWRKHLTIYRRRICHNCVATRRSSSSSRTGCTRSHLHRKGHLCRHRGLQKRSRPSPVAVVG